MFSHALSVVIPSFNEVKRLPPYLQQIQDYLVAILPSCPEVIVIDDGSSDGLAPVLQEQLGGWSALRLLRHPRNLGKGAALRTGLLAAQGECILFADADGATPIEEERKLRILIEQGADVAVGSRFTPTADSRAQRTWSRGLPGYAFAWAVRRCFDLDVADTQCGFKMFRREVAHRLCRLCREPGYLFDVEVLAWAQRLGYRIAEAPVTWRDVPGSKVHLVRDGCQMLAGLWRLRRSLRTDPVDEVLSADPAPVPSVLSGQ